MIQNDEQFIEAWLRWGHQTAKSQLEGLICGSTVELVVIPTIPALHSGAGRTIAKAWLGIKYIESASDAVENAAWSAAGGLQSITATEISGRGVILNQSEGSPELRFDVTAANSIQLVPHRTYYCGIKVLMSDGSLYPVEQFTFNTRQQIVADVS